MKDKIRNFILGSIVTMMYFFINIIFLSLIYVFIVKLDFVNVYDFNSGLLLYVIHCSY